MDVQPRAPRLAYGVAEIAAAMGISRALVYELIASGKLRSVKLGERTVIPAPEVHRLLGTNAEAAA